MEATRRSLLLSIPALIGFRGDVMSPRLETEIATLELTDLDGRRIRLAEFRGRVVLLYFWATWCAPSKAELPWLKALQQRFRASDFVAIAVSVDDDVSELASYVNHYAPGIIMAHRNNNSATSALYERVESLPTTILVARGGKILSINSERPGHETLERRVLQSVRTNRN